MPEILHGFNGIQIKTRKEYNDALAKAAELIQQLSATVLRFGEFTRFDYAYNVPCDPQALSQVLRVEQHPGDQTRQSGISQQRVSTYWE